MNNKTILDVCCGSRMFYFDKHNKNTIYMDCRELDETLCDGRNLVIAPDVVGDFRSIPFPDETFNLVIFDPPHLLNAGDASWLAKKYGKLDKNWKEDIRTGFNECMRVLKHNGTMVFKWNEEQIKLCDILKCIEFRPLLGQKRSKTHWLIFFKE